MSARRRLHALVVLLATAAALPAAAAQPQPIPAELKPAAQQAESEGRTLFRSHGAAPAAQSPRIATAMATAAAALKSRCTAPGRLMVLDEAPTADAIVLYEIPQLPPDKQGMMVGGFARLVLSGDGSRLVTPAKSLECVPSATDARTAPGPVILLDATSPVPTRYHVFANLVSGHRLVVVTSAGEWRIDHGVIQYFGPPN